MSDLHHTLYVGATMTGKTTMARYRARRLARTERRIVIYDPLIGTSTAGGGWPEPALHDVHSPRVVHFSDFEKFMRWVSKNGDADLFVDESARHFGQYDTENEWLLREGRHVGYAVHLIAQRPKMLSINVRTQCSEAFLFRMAKEDTKEICADLGHDCPEEKLDKGDYLMVKSYSPEIVKGNVFTLINRKNHA